MRWSFCRWTFLISQLWIIFSPFFFAVSTFFRLNESPAPNVVIDYAKYSNTDRTANSGLQIGQIRTYFPFSPRTNFESVFCFVLGFLVEPLVADFKKTDTNESQP